MGTGWQGKVHGAVRDRIGWYLNSHVLGFLVSTKINMGAARSEIRVRQKHAYYGSHAEYLHTQQRRSDTLRRRQHYSKNIYGNLEQSDALRDAHIKSIVLL